MNQLCFEAPRWSNWSQEPPLPILSDETDETAGSAVGNWQDTLPVKLAANGGPGPFGAPGLGTTDESVCWWFLSGFQETFSGKFGLTLDSRILRFKDLGVLQSQCGRVGFLLDKVLETTQIRCRFWRKSFNRSTLRVRHAMTSNSVQNVSAQVDTQKPGKLVLGGRTLLGAPGLTTSSWHRY